MSGHSKWSQIKHKKAATDAKRGELFSKLLKNIAIAARSNPNPQANPTLRAAIDKARDANVPSDNIERALARAREAKDNMETVVVEAYGPGGIALMVTATTDNRNRLMMELRKLLEDHGARVAEPGSARWAFIESAGVFEAKITQPVPDAEAEKLSALEETLQNHPDVESVVTNAEE
ncbi:MAG: YebC/PmpR family DNA-binding transcriptional regulator [bacterium]|nr:YebC/PmpR family DNA-binding transcriptional regulator [bacterium]MDZ4295792.1 YebC/PmpR family DNA-binding transcriptional regulator [Patescibacteria group bacterium]